MAAIPETAPPTLSVAYEDVEAAAARLDRQANQTPVVTSRTVNDRTRSQVFFKCENLQRTGSFKFRGAYSALSNLPVQERGIVTHSSGNHAQAIALAGKLLGISTAIVMPQDAPSVKQNATRGYGAEVILYDRTTTRREVFCAEIAQARGATIIPPFDHPDVIAGQGTAAKELFQEVGELDLLLVCCGGGGLLSGCAIAADRLSPNCRVVGVEPEKGDDVTRSFQTGTIQTVENPDTIADGARTLRPGDLTFPIIRHYVDEMLTVSDEALLRTMFFLWERLKLIVEPTGALAATALLEGIIQAPGQRVGVILSGGNADIQQLTRYWSVSS
ncbi:threo-3-hydroxy-L-aspartate ammonia-lyase [Phormidium tenue FACHB-886]|nr:threo-3-hydroxy-L-aspartate ammonia-lyase [Phormidium tenue FACHB-886]